MVDSQSKATGEIPELNDIGPVPVFRRVIGGSAQVQPIVNRVRSAQPRNISHLGFTTVRTLLVIHPGNRKRRGNSKFVGNGFDVGKVQGVSCPSLKIGYGIIQTKNAFLRSVSATRRLSAKVSALEIA